MAIPRRHFLKHAALSSALLAAQRAFGADLDRLELAGRTASDFKRLRDEYLLGPDVVYLNHASIGTTPRIVHEAHVRYLELCEANPWLYMWGGAWEEPREEVRTKAARLLGCETGEVAFTHNTTEAFNLLARGLPLGPGDEVVFSTLNHPGASIAWSHAASERGFAVRQFEFPIQQVPQLSPKDVLDLYDRHITPQTRVLVFPHIDNMVGLRYPIRELAQLAHSRGVEFVAVDGAQAAGMIPLDLRASGMDVYATSPHKWLQAPKGLGLTYVRKEVQESLRPMWVTWGQQRWKGSVRVFEDYGTRNLAEVLTLGDAIDFQLRVNSHEREQRLRSLWEFARNRVEQTDGFAWRSPTKWELSSSLYAVEVVGKKSTELFERLHRDHGLVYRAFATPALNTARLSPNVFSGEDELAMFFDRAQEGG